MSSQNNETIKRTISIIKYVVYNILFVAYTINFKTNKSKGYREAIMSSQTIKKNNFYYQICCIQYSICILHKIQNK